MFLWFIWKLLFFKLVVVVDVTFTESIFAEDPDEDLDYGNIIDNFFGLEIGNSEEHYIR